ncbi:hypothetical protein ACLOJK_026419 [Asimina triloba]
MAVASTSVHMMLAALMWTYCSLIAVQESPYPVVPTCYRIGADYICFWTLQDDPICVAARSDGKTLVTDLWVVDSLDLGRLADVNRILYRPVRDLKGIPGAALLHICLTGYQRQERDDIMKMVELMGAQFSKPLIAAKVTHLICYKFEGEKYELARKIGIKLVNHRLRTWEILPADNYNKSGWELEIMENEAQDSEEETEQGLGAFSRLNDRTFVHSSGVPKSEKEAPNKLQNIVSVEPLIHSPELPTPVREVPKSPQGGTGAGILSNGSDSLARMRETLKLQQTSSASGTLVHGSEFHSPLREAPNIQQHASTLKDPLNVTEDILMTERHVPPPGDDTSFDKAVESHGVSNRLVSPGSIPGKERSSGKGADSYDAACGDIEGFGFQDADSHMFTNIGHDIFSREACGTISNLNVVSNHKQGITPGSDQKACKRSPNSDFLIEKAGSRKTQKSAASSSPEPSNHLPSPAHGNIEENKVQGSLPPEQPNLASHAVQDPTVHKDPCRKEGLYTTFPQKRKLTVSRRAADSSMAVDDNITENPQITAVFVEDEHQNRQITSVFVEGEHPSMMVDEHQSKINPHLTNNPALTEGVSAVDSFAEQNSNKLKTMSGGLKRKPRKHRPVLAIKNSDSSNSSPYGKMKEPVDVEPNDMLDDPMSISNTTHNLASMAINSKNGETDKPVGVGGRSVIELPGHDKAAETPECSKELLLGSRPNNINISKSPNLGISHRQKSPESIKSNTGEIGVNTDAAIHVEGSDAKSSSKQRLRLLAKTHIGYRHRQPMNLSSKVNSASHSGKAVIQNHRDVTEPGKLNAGEDIEMIDSTCKDADVNLESKFEGDKQTTNRLSFDDVSVNAKEALLDAEKENEPSENGAQNMYSSRHGRKKVAIKKINKSKPQDNKKAVCSDSLQAGRDLGVEITEITACGGLNLIKEETIKGARTLNSSKIKATASGETQALLDSEKENKPSDNGGVSLDLSKHGQLNVATERFKEYSMGSNERVVQADADGLQADKGLRIGNSEPAWFILSGHRLQRKEFQHVIRRLRGRLCRDSHHWSYQATHFIMPDPVRRTEKFFAAAAAGRWILKTDYLTASSEAGRFLAEEPFEWYKSGLSEDGAISLEAPRKWRLLRERTGHGAFYGMRIVIYGECIAPPLDTLKRVVKAGDGTILATSPPYSRFLKAGVDFAVICPGMPHVDCWVQEFLRHEVPCITADYLVEHVCKPGYSLEKHVLYKTHAWAERSFTNISTHLEETVEASTPPESDNDDIACEVCGSRDRGEVMLICGNADGTLGCGVGTHIDCCNPTLEAVPEEDWFCSKCRSRGHTHAKGKRKVSSLKR